MKKRAARMSREARELKTLQLVYKALPRKEIKKYAAAACPCTFATMYDKMKENLNLLMQGVFGDYGLKLMLDMLVLTGGGCSGAPISMAHRLPGVSQRIGDVVPRTSTRGTLESTLLGPSAAGADLATSVP